MDSLPTSPSFSIMSATGALLTTVVTIGCVAILVQTLVQWYRLSHVPGPFWAAFSKAWMVRESLKGRQPQSIKAANDKYGSLVRIGPNELVTDDPEMLRRMNSVRGAYERGPWYDAMRFDPTRDNLFCMRDEEAHAKLRNKLTAGYAGKENESMEATIEHEIAKLVDLIETKYISSGSDYRPMDFGQKGQFFTLDVISHLAFGHAFGYLQTDDDVYDYIKITTSFIPIMMILSNIPTLARMLQSPMLRGLLPKESDKLGFGAFIGVAKSVVAKRFGPYAVPQSDMLGSFIRNGLTQEEASGEALLQVVAGSDTSATTIRIVLLHLLTNVSAHRKLQAEIDAGIAAGTISSPITNAEARKLPYLQAVIKEGLRIKPPAGGAFFKTVPPGGDTIDCKFIPGGTQLGVSPLGIQHSKKMFGEDAEMFVPERWLEAKGDKLEEMSGTVDLVFHSGKWQCLGKTVALMEFNKIFVELLRRFDFQIAHPERPAKIVNAGIWLIDEFWVRVTRRSESS